MKVGIIIGHVLYPMCNTVEQFQEEMKNNINRNVGVLMEKRNILAQSIFGVQNRCEQLFFTNKNCVIMHPIP